ncbi:hypothetical protein H9185_001184 [Listeria monocytogenes]|nr:hypothetical protein [Listeria monocytogenes]
MNESTIRELLSRLFAMSYTGKNEYIGNYQYPVISKEHRTDVENVIRQWALEFHDNRTGTLEAKVFVYEQIIKNSNFAPMLPEKDESGLLED